LAFDIQVFDDDFDNPIRILDNAEIILQIPNLDQCGMIGCKKARRTRF